MSGYAKDRPTDDTPFERMRYYIREIGQGPKAARDLPRAEARDAMEIVLRQEATRAQMGGFLLIERFKGESPEELLGFADAVRAHATRISPKVDGLLDIGSPYDGRRRSLVVNPAPSLLSPPPGPGGGVGGGGAERRERGGDGGQYELAPASPEEMAGGDAAYNAGACEAVLEGEAGARRDLVCLNAGLRLYLAERAADIAEGIARAREALDSGAARLKLEALRERARARAAV